jgi:hypothetical protein
VIEGLALKFLRWALDLTGGPAFAVGWSLGWRGGELLAELQVQRSRDAAGTVHAR